MRMIFKVSYYVRSNYENKQGKSPLMIRIFLNGEMLNVGSSGIYIDKKLWNNSTNRVKGRGSESLNLNAQLDNISNSLQMIFKKHEFDPNPPPCAACSSRGAEKPSAARLARCRSRRR